MAAASTVPDLIGPRARHRAIWFTFALLLIMAVGDGWSGRPEGTKHQLLVLPFTAAFLVCLWQMLFATGLSGARLWTPLRGFWICFGFEVGALVLFGYEGHHFRAVGYALPGTAWTICILAAIGLVLVSATRPARPVGALAATILAYAVGVALAISRFPLNYLRSDMLPVILWADTNLLHHLNPYATMFVGGRVYDFPYLPGMLVVYLPFVAGHLDLRFASIAALTIAAVLLFRTARPNCRFEVAALLGLFLLDPFLQYRHDLYLQPHWLTLVGAFVLMQRRHWVWGALVLGLGMAIYQFSWIILPFVLLNAFWRRGWLESLKLMLAATAGALLLAGPFLHLAFARISSNTVGQWGHFAHAIADPMNLSWWITFAIRPDKLLRLQALLMVAIFGWCFVRRRCATLEDTLRWTVVALTVFILCNSLVDGYFFLMLLVPMLLYTVIANGWLQKSSESIAIQTAMHAVHSEPARPAVAPS